MGMRPCLAEPRLPIEERSLKLSNSILPTAAMSPKVFMSMASRTASRLMRRASMTSMRAAAGYMPRLSRSDFQQTMVSKRPCLASASILWNFGHFLDHPLPTS